MSTFSKFINTPPKSLESPVFINLCRGVGVRVGVRGSAEIVEPSCIKVFPVIWGECWRFCGKNSKKHACFKKDVKSSCFHARFCNFAVISIDNQFKYR